MGKFLRNSLVDCLDKVVGIEITVFWDVISVVNTNG